jgi:thiol-disulfide isomerase/thioredoxin
MPNPRQLDGARLRRGVVAGRNARRNGGVRRLAAGLIALAAGVGASAGAPAAEAGSGGVTARHPVVQPAVVRVTSQDVRHMIRGAAGRVVLVNVWATWCVPCREEFPDLLKLRRALAGRDFDLVLVSADFDAQLPQVRSFLTRQGVDFTTYLKSESDTPFINGLDPAWSGSLPATFVYDKSGALRDFWEGRANYEKLLDTAVKLLGP